MANEEREMQPFSLDNENPNVKHRTSSISEVHEALKRKKLELEFAKDGTKRDVIDSIEIFDHIRTINDPEHPYSLEELSVVSIKDCAVDDEKSRVLVKFTPTVQHCSMATLIGLSIRVKLLRALPRRFKCDVVVSEGSHASERQVNKQLNDKERVAAALENANLLEKVELTLSGKTAM